MANPASRSALIDVNTDNRLDFVCIQGTAGSISGADAQFS
jgi:hypothetical protein